MFDNILLTDIKTFSKMSTRPINRDQAPVKLYSSSINKTNASSDAKVVYSNKCYRYYYFNFNLQIIA